MSVEKCSPRNRLPILFLLAAVCSLAAASGADDAVLLLGRVRGQNGTPGRLLRVSLIGKDRAFEAATAADEDGRFFIAGLPAGRFELEIEGDSPAGPPARTGIVLPMRQLYILEVTIPGPDAPGLLTVDRLMPESPPSPHETFIGRGQLDRLPSGNDVWTVIENQAFSETMNRIDVGGMWATRPGLFSARGGGSWTETAYAVNGVDATDPYRPGFPLFHPDLFALESLRLVNSDPPSYVDSPGGWLDLRVQEGGPAFHGRLSLFGFDKRLRSNNITPDLRKEGLESSHTIDSGLEGNFNLGGPIVKDRLFLFASWTSFKLGRDIAEFDKTDRSELSSGLVQLACRAASGHLKLLWTGQNVREPTYGAGRGIPVSATSDQDRAYDLAMVTWDGRLGERHSLLAGAVFNRGHILSDFQDDVSDLHGNEILKNIPSGAAATASSSVRSSCALFARGSSVLSAAGARLHRLDYGFELRSTRADTSGEVLGGRHLRFYEGRPLEVVDFDRPAFSHGERGLHLTAYAQDRLSLERVLSIEAGLNFSACYGRPVSGATAAGSDENRIRWMNLSPRISLTVPLTAGGSTALSVAAGRYYYGMPLNFLVYGQPEAPGALVYAWEDSNGDGRFQDVERGLLLRREGPAYGGIDPDIKRPFTDVYSVSARGGLGRGWRIALAGFYRETRNIAETVNTGVPFSSYDPVEIDDPGDDLTPGTHDDLIFTVYNQKVDSLGLDWLFLTNPESPVRLVSRYRGLDLTLVKPFGERGGFFLAATATEAVGTTSPGLTEWENDDGLPGALYDDPNTLINAKGRLRFDRAYVVRTGLALDGPAGTRLAILGKYYDGQPFARWIVVEGFNQGPFAIMAHPRGVARYEFNMTWDLRVEKIFAWGGSRLRLILDGFNVFNQHLATVENPWTGPDWPLRFASEIESPRIFRLGLAYEF